MPLTNPNLLGTAASEFEGGTAGWTAGSNTTLAATTGATLSGKNLKLTPTSAGSVAVTSPRVAVTEGTTYLAYIPVFTSAATAGRVFTASLVWYDAASGGSAVGSASAHAQTLTTDGSASWFYDNRACVFGEAPEGAVSAALLLTCTNLTAAEYLAADQVYVGVSPSDPANLLAPNVETNESDVSGWSATNGATSRAHGWIGASNVGNYVLSVVASAAGTVTITTADYAQIGSATGLYGEVLLMGADFTSDVIADVLWYDGTNTLLDTDTITDFSLLSAGVAYRISFAGTPPEGAASFKIRLSVSADTAGRVIYMDQALAWASGDSADNLLTYDEYSSENDTGAWVSDEATLSRRYLYLPGAVEGAFTVGVVPDSPTVVNVTLDRAVPVTAGDVYRFSSALTRHNSSTEIIGFRARTSIHWYDEDDVLISGGGTAPYYTYDSSSANLTFDMAVTDVAPDTASFARCVVQIDHGNAPLIDFYAIDKNVLAVSTADYTLSVDDERGAVDLTVYWVPTPAEGLVSIRRFDADGSSTYLRGYDGLMIKTPFTGGPISVEDYEAPLAQEVWYQVSFYETDGTPGNVLYTTYVGSPKLPDGDHVWFKSPGLPAVNTTVIMETVPAWEQADNSASYRIVGRRNPVSRSDVRSGRTSAFTFLVLDSHAHAQLGALLATGSPALVQAMPGLGMDGNTYVSIGSVTSASVTGNAAEPGWRWTLPVTEIDRPVSGLRGSSAATWDDVDTTFLTWMDVYDAYDTWADMATADL